MTLTIVSFLKEMDNLLPSLDDVIRREAMAMELEAIQVIEDTLTSGAFRRDFQVVHVSRRMGLTRTWDMRLA